MKVTKLIIPLLGLTSINNNNINNQTSQTIAIQIEKEMNIPYEILPKESEYNNYLINQQINLNSFESAKMPTSYSEVGCDALYRSIMDTCNALTGAKKVACQVAAYSSYLICLAAPGASE